MLQLHHQSLKSSWCFVDPEWLAENNFQRLMIWLINHNISSIDVLVKTPECEYNGQHQYASKKARFISWLLVHVHTYTRTHTHSHTHTHTHTHTNTNKYNTLENTVRKLWQKGCTSDYHVNHELVFAGHSFRTQFNQAYLLQQVLWLVLSGHQRPLHAQSLTLVFLESIHPWLHGQLWEIILGMTIFCTKPFYQADHPWQYSTQHLTMPPSTNVVWQT